MTPKEASDLIETAINKAIQSSEEYDDGDIITDWVCVTFVTNPDEEKGQGYPTFFSNGTMPNYRARGLLLTALLQVPGEE